MVCEWGMSDELGPLSFGRKEEQIFIGREISQHRDYSEQTALTIDREIRNIVDQNHKRAKQIVSDNIEALKRIAEALIEYETIDGAEVDQLIRGEKITRAEKKEAVSETKKTPDEGGGETPVTPPVLA